VRVRPVKSEGNIESLECKWCVAASLFKTSEKIMSNNQAKREAAERHNKALEDKKNPVKRIVTGAGKSRIRHAALALVMGFSTK
jgi:hypothetical protein